MYMYMEGELAAKKQELKKVLAIMSDGSSNLFFLRSLTIIAPDEVNGSSSSDNFSNTTGSDILTDPFAALFGNPDNPNGAAPEGEDGFAQPNMPAEDMGMGMGGGNNEVKLSRRAMRELRRNRKKNPNAMNLGPRRRRRDAEDMPAPRRGRFGRNQQDTEMQTAEGEQLVEVPVKRQEYLAFSPKVTTWRLRFDFIEFNLTDEEKAAEAAEQSN